MTFLVPRIASDRQVHGSLIKGSKSGKAIFSIKVTIKVTKSLTLVTFERALLVKYTP